jgi:hypothetical protein
VGPAHQLVHHAGPKFFSEIPADFLAALTEGRSPDARHFPTRLAFLGRSIENIPACSLWQS